MPGVVSGSRVRVSQLSGPGSMRPVAGSKPEWRLKACCGEVGGPRVAVGVNVGFLFQMAPRMTKAWTSMRAAWADWMRA